LHLLRKSKEAAVQGYPTAGDERVEEACAKAHAEAACVATAGCAWNATAKSCAEHRRAVETAETELELYSVLGAGVKGIVLYRPCDDLHGKICTIGTPTCHGIMDNATIWDHAKELNAIARQALALLAFAVPVPNASRSNLADTALRHDVFCVRHDSLAVVLFNRQFISTVPEFSVTPLHNISVSMALPPWLTGSGEEELVAHQLLGSQGRRELTLHAAGAGWVEVRLDALITGTVVVVSRSALPSSAAGAQPPPPPPRLPSLSAQKSDDDANVVQPLKADDGEASPTERGGAGAGRGRRV